MHRKASKHILLSTSLLLILRSCDRAL